MRTVKLAAMLAVTVFTGLAGLLSGASVPADAAVDNTRGISPLGATGARLRSSALVPSHIDIGFAQSMIAHHNQALFLAMMVQNHPDEFIAHLAQNIRQQQSHENGLMLGWLNAWGAAPMTLDNMAWVNQTNGELSADDVLFISRCSASPGAMPGEISSEELKKLKQAAPQEQARLFLSYMNRHHQAAVEMASFASRHVSLPFVRSFALSVIKEQGREIALMERAAATLHSIN